VLKHQVGAAQGAVKSRAGGRIGAASQRTKRRGLFTAIKELSAGDVKRFQACHDHRLRAGDWRR
jgi:hypothetical protein